VGYSSALGWPVPLVLITALALGAIIGAVNALFVVKLGVNAFIATLAMATILAGLNLLVTNGQILFDGVPAALTNIGKSTLAGIVQARQILSIRIRASGCQYHSGHQAKAERSLTSGRRTGP
jgi:ribose/xylose/arabinose/galactoside ABC-type transport system permease subunit